MRHPLAEICLVQRAWLVGIAARMFYAFRAFDILPHGSDQEEDRDDMICALKNEGNYGRSATIHEINPSEMRSLIHDYFRVVFPGSEEIRKFELLKLSWQPWLDFVLDNGVFNGKRKCWSTLRSKGAQSKLKDLTGIYYLSMP